MDLLKHHLVEPCQARPDPSELLKWRQSRTTRWFLAVMEARLLKNSLLPRSETGPAGWRELNGYQSAIADVMRLVNNIQEEEG